MVLRKKEVYTVITPVPGFIPRQLAIDILHSHREVITLNPLVLDVKEIKAPRTAPSDEFFSTWYEITERLQVVPGVGRLGSSVIRFNGCFHDLPWGLQTHIYAPLNIDMRNKYRVGGNQPGVEPPEPQEMGLAALGAPKDGLYLREDIEFKCNITMVGVVKAQMKAASKEMVDRIIKKAELLDAGVLQAMIEDGKLRTIHGPQDGSQPGSDYTGGLRAGSAMSSPPASPGPGVQPPLSPSIPYQVPRPLSLQHQGRPVSVGSNPYQQQQQLSPNFPPPSYNNTKNPLGQNPSYQNQKFQQHAVEMPNNQAPTGPIIMELPGDNQYYPGHQPPQPSPQFQQQQPEGHHHRGGSVGNADLGPIQQQQDWNNSNHNSGDYGGTLHHSNSVASHYSQVSNVSDPSRNSYSSNPANRWSQPSSLGAIGHNMENRNSGGGGGGSRPPSLNFSDAGGSGSGGNSGGFNVSPGLPDVQEEPARRAPYPY